MKNDTSVLKNWLDCIFRDQDNMVHEYVYEAYELIEAMNDPSAVFTMHWDYEKLQPEGLRLKEKFYGDHVLDITSSEQQRIYLDYLQKQFCNERFKTMADWFVYCSQKI